jgi:hypothetical protein
MQVVSQKINKFFFRPIFWVEPAAPPPPTMTTRGGRTYKNFGGGAGLCGRPGHVQKRDVSNHPLVEPRRRARRRGHRPTAAHMYMRRAAACPNKILSRVGGGGGATGSTQKYRAEKNFIYFYKHHLHCR